MSQVFAGLKAAPPEKTLDGSFAATILGAPYCFFQAAQCLFVSIFFVMQKLSSGFAFCFSAAEPRAFGRLLLDLFYSCAVLSDELWRCLPSDSWCQHFHPPHSHVCCSVWPFLLTSRISVAISRGASSSSIGSRDSAGAWPKIC